jgi:starch-binding outer membrane protein, SusD/RagB family
MKKIINKVAIAGVFSLLVIGCVDLNKQPMGVETDQTFFKTGDQAVRAVTGIYDATAWYNSQEMDEWVFGDICSDDAQKGGENDADAPQMLQMKMFNCPADVQYINDIWGHSYQGIFRANEVIDNVPGIPVDVAMDATTKTRLIGEAKFLRALFYFRLVRIFSDVPLVLHPLTREQYCQARTPVAEVWAQMQTDLTDAAAALPEKKTYDAANIGRATKGAANALLTKAYIFQAKWAEAKAKAAEVVASGQYSLEPKYEDVWKLSHENGTESIFEFQHVQISNPNWGDQNEGCVTQIYTRGRSYKNQPGWGYVCPTDNFKAEFETGDPRYKMSVIEEGDTIWKGTPWEEIANNKPSPTLRYGRKYFLEYTNDPPAMSNGPANWRFMRYADLLLWSAEALCQLGETGPALTQLNLVRARVGMPAQTETGKDALLKLIYHERRVELGLEGHRFFDIIRTGRGTECLGANGYTEKKKYLPIPKSELDMCPKLVNNPYFD